MAYHQTAQALGNTRPSILECVEGVIHSLFTRLGEREICPLEFLLQLLDKLPWEVLETVSDEDTSRLFYDMGVYFTLQYMHFD